eukprot:4819537-Amphidinium_carterae.1
MGVLEKYFLKVDTSETGGPHMVPWPRTLRLAEKLWGRSRNIERLTIPQKGRLVVVGDTHGQLEDVLWMFFKYGPPSPSN